jgi:serine/threonine protein kinase
MNGGELFYHLKKKKRFSESLVRFYAAEMALGIAYLHSQNIIYRYYHSCMKRDLKPENVLLDEEGHLRLADFGLSKVCYNHHDKVFTMCGTPEYVAPEVLSNCISDVICRGRRV